ncbi:MAG: NADH-quinone oxidoreductase subunit L [Nitrospirae bacterium]|nr:NADH-quinone oxidoreductase subunit L [Nitrospirota bacterium]
MLSVVLIPLLPLLAVLINGVFGRKYLKESAHYFAVGAVAISFILSISLLMQMMSGAMPIDVTVYSWVFGGGIDIPIGFLIDPLSSVMLMVVTGVGLLIHIYSIGYMHGDEGYYRFFTYLNLFMVSMLLLVMGDNYLVLFIGWEGVGLCSYLLIAFWFEKESAIKAGTKAFVVNRIGDAGFLIAIFLIAQQFGTLNYLEVFDRAHQLSTGMATAIALCLFIGAIGKSAQIPLYTWLPDAMEGPTPVSALIHAATMVTAGVYMVVRNHAIYDLAPIAMTVVAVTGGATAIFAAPIGLVQTDIKRVLAYSTVSQLGYMFLGCGVGAYAAAIFHLVTHAFFKALLFLGSGSVIHALGGEQDIRKMGGLKAEIPVTALTFLVGTIAIAGLPPLAGFWSKDEILGMAFKGGHPVLWLVGMTGAFLTSFYMFRLFYVTFTGETRMEPAVAHHVHESPSVMTVPLMILAGLSLLGGVLLGFPPEQGWLHDFLAPMIAGEGAEAHHDFEIVDLALMAGSVLVALAGWWTAYTMYVRKPELAPFWAARFRGAHTLLLNKYWVDEAYDAVFVEPSKRLGRAWGVFDRIVIDGIVNGVGRLTTSGAWLSTWIEKYILYGFLNVIGYSNHLGARVLRRLQTGYVHHYAFIVVVGLFLMVYVILWWHGDNFSGLLVPR